MNENLYENLIKQLPYVLEGESHFISNMANFSALLFQTLPNLNWVGFYLRSNNDLILGPFQGKTACVRIAMGKGVCGSAATEKRTIVVDDVHQFPGHIACDSASNSEIVIPIIIDGNVIGVLDIDSPIYNRFSPDDQFNLELLLQILINHTDMASISKVY